MTTLYYKNIHIASIIVTLIVILFSLYFQFVIGLDPCPLCIMQRGCVFIILVVLLISFKIKRKLLQASVIQILFASAGLFFATRQLWLQHLPVGQIPACMPGLDILIHYFPWQAVAKSLLWGSGDCAEATWSALGITMPGWSALYFIGVIGVSLITIYYNSSLFNKKTEKELI